MRNFARHLLALTCIFLMLPTACMAQSASTGPDFASDYAYLWHALQEDYPFLPLLAARGVNAAELEKRYDEAAADCSDLPSYAALLSDMLQRMNNFAHLSLVSPDAYSSYLSLVGQGLLSPMQESLLLDKVTSAAYQSLKAPEASTTSLPALPEVSYVSGDDILIIRISSFSHSCLDRDAALVTDALALYPDARHIIFDISGNRGGSDYYWINNIVAPFGGSYACESILFFRDTPLTRAYQLTDGAVTLEEFARTQPVPEIISALGLTHARVETLRYPSSVDEKPAVSDARRWVLMDGGVYSAADSFAAFCKETGWATLVGQQTMGDGGNVGPVLIQLPSTGLLVQFSCVVTLNTDGSLNALAGALPDFQPKPGETPLNACIRLIRTIQ